jgi:succinate dehydrogenase / fumarate reductase iron-sulfur subunit
MKHYTKMIRFSIYRFDPDKDSKPYMQDYQLDESKLEGRQMLLDAILLLKEQDESLSFRRSCREGVCGSDAMNINGRNGLACITPWSSLKQPIKLNPLPGMPVIRDLIVDMEPFYRQYRTIKPWLMNDEPEPEIERLQSNEDRKKLDGLYECILCGCCSTACPSFWWNPDKYLGPAALLQSYRFLVDSRDKAINERLDELEDPFRLFRCHSIMNCVEACPRDLNPAQAIHNIRKMLLNRAT